MPAPRRHRHGSARRRPAPVAYENLPQVELTVGAPGHGGAAVARDADGCVVFVRHALPGERVRARITAQRKALMWADAVEILEASPDRQPSVWPEAGPGGVGGGELAHVTPEGQRRWKSAVLVDQMRRIGGEVLAEQCAALGPMAVEVRPTPADAPDQAGAASSTGRGDLRGWRSRVEFVIDSSGRPAMHGFRALELVALKDLPLAMPQILETGVLDPDSVWPTLWRPGDRVRVVAQTGVPLPEVLVAIMRKDEVRIFDSHGDPVDDSHITHRIQVDSQDFSYRVRMEGFWQAHREGAQVLAGEVARRAACQPGDAVIELYSGAGLFSQVLAHHIGPQGHLVTVEGAEEAVADAVANLVAFDTVDACVGWIDESAVLDAAAMLGRTPALIVMDPPREGAGREVAARVASLGAEKIILVACDPASGARDLRALVENGYTLAQMSAWDLYPYTHHVEFVALVEKNT